MARMAEQLVGRPTQLEAFDEILAGLEHGGPAVLELVGEPGIGKTRLLRELAERADARGYLVLSGSASELERDLPFWVFVDALDEYAEGLDPRRLEALSDRTLAELAHVLPALSAHDLAAATGIQDERYRTHRAIRELLEMLAGEQAARRSSSTTCTGPTPDRSSCSGRSCAVRRRLQSCSPWPCAPIRRPIAWRPPSSGPIGAAG